MSARTTIVLELTDAEAEMLQAILMDCVRWESTKHAEDIYEAIDAVKQDRGFGTTRFTYDKRCNYFVPAAPTTPKDPV